MVDEQYKYIRIGLLINFGETSLKFKRLTNKKHISYNHNNQHNHAKITVQT
jgi:hypothetical protein